MNTGINRTQILRMVTEIAALVVVVWLVVNYRLQLWFILLAAGVLLSMVAVRFLCGWVCRMQTLFRAIGQITRWLCLKRLPVPNFVRSPVIRYAAWAVFVFALVGTRVSGSRANLFPFLIGVSVVLTFIFTEELWHRYLCLFGAVLSLTTRPSGRGMRIDQEACISCGACARPAPPEPSRTAGPPTVRSRSTGRRRTLSAAGVFLPSDSFCAAHCPLLMCSPQASNWSFGPFSRARCAKVVVT